MQAPLFNQLVKESAESVQNREDVDSVPIIDDIRYHVTLLHGDGELSGQLRDLTSLRALFLGLLHYHHGELHSMQLFSANLRQPTRSELPLCVAANTDDDDDDEEDVDVLDPAQLATASVYDPQLAQQTQEHHLEQQQPTPSVEDCQQFSTHQLPDSFQSAAAEDAMLHQHPNAGGKLAAEVGPGDESLRRPQGWQQLHAAQQWQDSQEEEELIRMDDPMFSTLSERRQKLMALEEILLNTGIEG